MNAFREQRGVLVLAISAPTDGPGTYPAESVVASLVAMLPDDWLDVHGPDAWELDEALDTTGLVLRKEERHEPARGFRAGARHIVRCFGTRTP